MYVVQSDAIKDILHDLLTVVPLRSVHSVQIHAKHDLVMLVLLKRFRKCISGQIWVFNL